jgi:AsmA protein
MALRRPLKILGLVLGIIVALVILVVVTVLLVVDPNDYKDRIEAAVEEKTGRPLTLEGDLELAFFPWLAIELGPAQLGQPQGFEGGPFLVVDKAQVGVKLIPLLSRRLEVSRLGLEGMKVQLVKNADGRTNWEDLLEEDETAEEPPGDGPVIGTIGGLTVKDAALDYRDLQEGTRRRILDLDIETGAINPGEPVDVEATVVTDEGPDTATLNAKLTTRLTMNSAEQRYQLARLVLDATQSAPASERKEGDEAANDLAFGLKADTVDIDLARQVLSLPQFAFTFAGAEITGNLQGEKIVAAPSLAGQIAMRDTSPRELMRQLGMEIPRTRDPDALKQLNLNSKLRATDNSVALDDLRIVFDGQQVTGTFAIADLEKMALRFDLEADRLDLSRYEDPTKDEDAKQGPGEQGGEKEGGAEPFKLPVEALRELDAKGTFAIGSLKVAGMALKDVSFRLDAADGVTKLNPARSHMFGGSQLGNVSVNAKQPVASVNVEEKLTGIDFAELFETMLDSKRVTGKGNAHAVLSGRGNDSDAILSTLDGRVEFEVQDGAILGADLWYEIQRARALWKKEAMPAQASSGMTRFQQLRGTAVIKDGVVVNRDFIMDMDYLKVRGEGSLALATKEVDYRLTAEVYDLPATQEAGTQPSLADLKEAEIPVRVSGTLDDLKIRPDLAGLAKARARQEIEKRKDELQDKALDKLSDWLGKKKKPE